MANITASMVKELREKTGAGMMDCKKALAEADGDMEKAIDELRKRGQAIANKASARTTREGLIFSKVDETAGALLELNCVTDFVARNEDFVALGNTLVELVHAGVATTAEQLLDAQHPTAGKPVREVLTDAIAKTGENMNVSRIQRIQVTDNTVVVGYIHPPGKLGVLVQLEAAKPETLKSPAVKALGADLAMQVAAAAPIALDREAVPAEIVERERAIYLDQVKMEGKPEQMWDRIVEGKMSKFYKDSCLVDQAFIKDQDQSVRQLVESVGKQVGDTISIVRFERFLVGETAKPEEEAEA